MTTSRLETLQSDFREFLYRGHHEHTLAAQVRTGGGASPGGRLNVYRNAYFIRLEQATAHNFPVTEKVLGKRVFAHCAGEYALDHPSRSPDLRQFGDRFSAWLRAEKSPALGDLAAIEWAALAVFDGPDGNAVDANCLRVHSPADWSRLIIRLMPTLTLLPLESNADRVWLAKGDGIELLAQPGRHIAIWRVEPFRPMLRTIDRHIYAVLTVLASEPRLAAASEYLAHTMDQEKIPQRIAAALHWALAHGWVAAVEITHQKLIRE